jgi:hypothetical protein
VGQKWIETAMIILTCANGEPAKSDSGKIFENFSFKEVIRSTALQAQRCGYTTVVYDLGDLGIGIPYQVTDKSFIENGYYEQEVVSGYKSKSLFKPDIVGLCLREYHQTVAYLDGDAQLLGRIDEVDTADYDIGVTLRAPSELESDWHRTYREVARFVNAGVIFFRPTAAARSFVDNWKKLTETLGNDQMALNQLTCSEDYPEVNSIVSIDGVRVKYFPGEKYNYYYFKEGLEDDIKILHFKGAVRHFYPFDWKKRMYCMVAVPAINYVKSIIKKRIS